MPTNLPNRQMFPVYVAVGVAVWLPIQSSITFAILLIHPPYSGMSVQHMMQSSEHRMMLAFGEAFLSGLLMTCVVGGMSIALNRRNRSQ
jgi:hypothetical protein